MSPRLLVVAAVLFLLAFAVAYVVIVTDSQVSNDVLAERIAQSEPQWANYQEDIKAQIGAAPVAEWDGHPVSAGQDSTVIFVEFELRGPWAARPVAIPILLRDPYGLDHRPSQSRVTNGVARYEFALTDESAATLPWIELKYPHHERRIVLDINGLWNEPTENHQP